MAENDKMQPVLIPKGMLGATRDLVISRQHAVLLSTDRLVRAIHLAEARGVRARVAKGKREVTYLHLMFDAHQIIFAENVASESFYPGANALHMLTPEALTDLVQVCPELAKTDDLTSIAEIYGPTARPILTRYEVATDASVKSERSDSGVQPCNVRWPVAA